MAQNQNNRNYNGAIWNMYSFRKPRTPNTENRNPSQNKPVQLIHRPSLIKKIANEFESAIANSSAKTKEFAREKDKREHDQHQPSLIKKIANEFESAMGIPSSQTKEFAREKDRHEHDQHQPSHIKKIANEFESAMGIPSAQTKEFAPKKDGCEPCSDFPVKEIMIVYSHDNNNNSNNAHNVGKPVSRTKLVETDEVAATVMSNEGKFLGYISMVKKRVVRAVSSIGGAPSSRSKDSFNI